MFQSLRAEIEAACQEADRLQAECERADWLRAQRQKQSAPTEIVRKTYAPRPAVQPQPQPTIMDDESSARWNRWLSDYVERAIKQYNAQLSESLIDGVGEAFSIERADMRKHISEEVRQLREEIGQLRAEMTVDRAITRGEVSQLEGSVPAKRRSDVA